MGNAFMPFNTLMGNNGLMNLPADSKAAVPSWDAGIKQTALEYKSNLENAFSSWSPFYSANAVRQLKEKDSSSSKDKDAGHGGGYSKKKKKGCGKNDNGDDVCADDTDAVMAGLKASGFKFGTASASDLIAEATFEKDVATHEVYFVQEGGKKKQHSGGKKHTKAPKASGTTATSEATETRLVGVKGSTEKKKKEDEEKSAEKSVIETNKAAKLTTEVSEVDLPQFARDALDAVKANLLDSKAEWIEGAGGSVVTKKKILKLKKLAIKQKHLDMKLKKQEKKDELEFKKLVAELTKVGIPVDEVLITTSPTSTTSTPPIGEQPPTTTMPPCETTTTTTAPPIGEPCPYVSGFETASSQDSASYLERFYTAFYSPPFWNGAKDVDARKAFQDAPDRSLAVLMGDPELDCNGKPFAMTPSRDLAELLNLYQYQSSNPTEADNDYSDSLFLSKSNASVPSSFDEEWDGWWLKDSLKASTPLCSRQADILALVGELAALPPDTKHITIQDSQLMKIDDLDIALKSLLDDCEGFQGESVDVLPTDTRHGLAAMLPDPDTLWGDSLEAGAIDPQKLLALVLEASGNSHPERFFELDGRIFDVNNEQEELDLVDAIIDRFDDFDALFGTPVDPSESLSLDRSTATADRYSAATAAVLEAVSGAPTAALKKPKSSSGPGTKVLYHEVSRSPPSGLAPTLRPYTGGSSTGSTPTVGSTASDTAATTTSTTLIDWLVALKSDDDDGNGESKENQHQKWYLKQMVDSSGERYEDPTRAFYLPKVHEVVDWEEAWEELKSWSHRLHKDKKETTKQPEPTPTTTVPPTPTPEEPTTTAPTEPPVKHNHSLKKQVEGMAAKDHAGHRGDVPLKPESPSLSPAAGDSLPSGYTVSHPFGGFSYYPSQTLNVTIQQPQADAGQTSGATHDSSSILNDAEMAELLTWWRANGSDIAHGMAQIKGAPGQATRWGPWWERMSADMPVTDFYSAWEEVTDRLDYFVDPEASILDTLVLVDQMTPQVTDGSLEARGAMNELILGATRILDALALDSALGWEPSLAEYNRALEGLRGLFDDRFEAMLLPDFVYRAEHILRKELTPLRDY